MLEQAPAGPNIEVERISGAVRVMVHPRFTLRGGVSVLSSAALLYFFIRSGWHGVHSVEDVALLLLLPFALWNALRELLSEEIIEISSEKIVMQRLWIFGGNRVFPADKISNLGVGGESESGKRWLTFTYRWKPVRFALGISEADASRVLEAIGAMGAVGAVSSSDPFGKDASILRLDLHK